MELRSDLDYTISGVIFNTLKKASIVGILYLAGYMKWSVGWFVAPVIFLAVREHWKTISNRRRDITKAIGMSSEKDVVLAKFSDLPAWVFFPDVERVEWINRIMKQVWPNVNHYARDLIRDSIQPALKQKLEGYKLSGFKFERIILGNVPFRIGGVKVYDKNIDRNEIIMDLDIFYAGDCDITFYLAGMKAGIRDFQLHGMLRVVMKPLISTIPLVGGLQVFFLNNPDIDFDLVGIADILDMPGLSEVLRRIVVETVASMMVLPNKFPIQLSDQIEPAELKAPEPEGVLRVHLVEAKHLMKKDIGMLGKGKSDPYAVITLGAQEFKTKVIDNTVDPKWDFWCEFNVMESNGQQLYLHVWDRDETSDDERLGRATIEVSNIVKKGEDDMWVTLEQAKHGMVHLRLTWFSLSTDYSDLRAALAETQLLRVTSMSTALLTIFIDSAKNLPHARPSTKPDPYVVIKVGNTTHQTKVQMRTVHPVWEEGFSFLVANPESDAIYVNIIDQKTTKDLGHVIYDVNKMVSKPNLDLYKEPLMMAKSGPESKIVWSLSLRILKRTNKIEEYNEEPKELQRSDSKTSTASQEVPPQTEPIESAIEEGVEALIEDSSVPQLSATPTQEKGDLFHRTPDTAVTAGVHDLGRIQLTLRYSVQRQRLVVVVHKVANIPLKDPSNIPDPYIKLYLLPERAKDTKRKTQVIKDNCSPVFDESFEYVLSQGELNTKQLEITVASQKQLFYSGSNILGMVVIDFAKLNLSQPYTSWFDLNPESQYEN